MTIIKHYTQFGGLHYETGPIFNVLAHLGVKAPHTGQSLSEALLMGVSGGATFGYFLFDYKGYAPMLSLLSRNTFDPVETLLSRLAIPREVRQTTDASKALANLRQVLDSGQPAIALVDQCTLYNAGAANTDWWAMMPVVVYGLDSEGVHIADRSHMPNIVSQDRFIKAWGRIKKDKHRLTTLAAPDLTKLRDAVQKGVGQCISLYTEKPPKGAKTNFGFEAYRHWAAMLINTRNPQGWARFFPAGSKHWAAMTGSGMAPGLIGWIYTWGLGGGMERGVFAQFLDEAAALLKRPKLKVAADGFRASQNAWLELGQIAMPENVPMCHEARELMRKRHSLFVEHGAQSATERDRVNARLAELRARAASDFPLSEGQLTVIRAAMSEQVMRIHNLEFDAIKTLQGALG